MTGSLIGLAPLGDSPSMDSIDNKDWLCSPAKKARTVAAGSRAALIAGTQGAHQVIAQAPAIRDPLHFKITQGAVCTFI